MARWVMAAGLVLVGCGVAPQPDAGVPNRPPRIVDTTPQLRSTRYTSTLCPSLNDPLSVVVADEDQDSIRSLWLIDQDMGTRPFATSPTAGDAQLQLVNAPTSLLFRTELANLSAGVHLLSVYVADAEFNEVVGGTITAGSAAVPGFVDSFTFVFDVSPCP